MSAAGAGSIAEAPPEIKHSNTSFALMASIVAKTRLEALTPSWSGVGWSGWNVAIRLSVIFKLEVLGETRIPETTCSPKILNDADSMGALAFPTAITRILELIGVRTLPI